MEKQIPKLRFPEFSGEWEKKKLNKFATLNPKNTSLPDSFIYIDLESVTNGLLVKENIINKIDAPSRAQRILSKEDILFQTVRPYQKNNLFFDKFGEYVASTGYAQIRTKNDSQFLFQFLHTEKFVSNVMLRCTGTSYPAINSSDLSELEISFPSLPEQTKIATFLTEVDKKLTALKQKKTLLEQYKKGVMQQIFSQELRFKDDNGNDFPDWEEKKLGEIGDVKMCKRIFNDETSLEGEIPFYKIGSFGKVADAFITKEKYLDFRKKYSFPKKGDILISAAGTIGRTVIYNGEDAYYQDSNIVWISNDDSNVSNKFLFYIYQIVKYNTEGGTIQRLYNNILKSTKFNCPSLQEQTKIANFLSAIDEKIKHCQGQIEKTAVWKKGLLQQLFV